MDIEITSVAHKEQRAGDVAAAVYVITQEDIRRRADARLEVPLTRRLSVAVAGQNLFDDMHAEYAGAGAIVTPTLIPRNAPVSRGWRP